MTDFLNKKKFNDLVAERIEGLIFFQEILSPVLRIRRGTESCFAVLGAYKKTKSERRFLPALTPEHD